MPWGGVGVKQAEFTGWSSRAPALTGSASGTGPVFTASSCCSLSPHKPEAPAEWRQLVR